MRAAWQELQLDLFAHLAVWRQLSFFSSHCSSQTPLLLPSLKQISACFPGLGRWPEPALVQGSVPGQYSCENLPSCKSHTFGFYCGQSYVPTGRSKGGYPQKRTLKARGIPDELQSVQRTFCLVGYVYQREMFFSSQNGRMHLGYSHWQPWPSILQISSVQISILLVQIPHLKGRVSRENTAPSETSFYF